MKKGDQMRTRQFCRLLDSKADSVITINSIDALAKVELHEAIN